MSQVTGKVAQIIGPVVDVAFASGAELPKIYDSLEVNNNGNLLILEVQSVRILCGQFQWIQQMD